jgi:hypothetical protein
MTESAVSAQAADEQDGHGANFRGTSRYPNVVALLILSVTGLVLVYVASSFVARFHSNPLQLDWIDVYGMLLASVTVLFGYNLLRILRMPVFGARAIVMFVVAMGFLALLIWTPGFDPAYRPVTAWYTLGLIGAGGGAVYYLARLVSRLRTALLAEMGYYIIVGLVLMIALSGISWIPDFVHNLRLALPF